ncbi:MAG TPA: hypothetical protein VFS39_15040 [Nitrospira sp.]|nr:hypothetical protein [Nitrospira sp.]
MNRSFSEHGRGRTWLFVFAFAFLFVSYLTDVVYLPDFTPTHFAQEAEDKNYNTAVDGGVLFIADLCDQPLIDLPGPSKHPPGNILGILGSDKISPLQCLASASLISRPPPSFTFPQAEL